MFSVVKLTGLEPRFQPARAARKIVDPGDGRSPRANGERRVTGGHEGSAGSLAALGFVSGSTYRLADSLSASANL